MSDKPTPPFVLRKKSPEELERIRTEREARHTEQQDAIRAAAAEFMRPMYERAREAMDATLAVQRATMPDLSEMVRRLTIPDELLLTPEEREQKEDERLLNELVESSRRNDELLRKRIQDDRARFIRDMAEANAAAIIQAQAKSEPAQAGKAEPMPPQYFKRAALVERLGPYMKDPDKLPGLLANANVKRELQACRAPNGKMWDFGRVCLWLLKNGYLKAGVGDAQVKELLNRARLEDG